MDEDGIENEKCAVNPNTRESTEAKDNEINDEKDKHETQNVLDEPENAGSGSKPENKDLDEQITENGTLMVNEASPNDTKEDANKSGEQDELMIIKTEPEDSEELIITGLSDEILKLNPDFSAIHGFGYGLRKRDKVIKETYQPTLSENRKPRKRNHIVHYSMNEEDKVQCTYCPKVFDTKTGLWNHLRMHKVKTLQDIQTIETSDSTTFKCMLCKKTFDKNIDLVSHKKDAHSDEDPFLCKRCKVAFVDHYEYLIHKLSHRKVSSSYYCEECSKCLTTKTGFKIHIGTHFDKKISCDICSAMFSNEQSMIKHKNSHANTVYKTCGECGKDIKDRHHFKYHMLSHTGVRPYQCLYCGKGFRSEQQRKTHTRVHTDERPYKCEICPQSFRQSTDMKRHMESHNKKDKKIACQYCDKKFLRKEYLQFHVRRHLNSNLFKCMHCTHTAMTKGALRTHIIHKHTSEALYKCDICNVAFKMRQGLNKHLKSLVHRNNTYGAVKKGIIKN